MRAALSWRSWGSLQRVCALVRTRLASGPRERIPVSAIFVHAVLATFVCALARGTLPPFAYGFFALSLMAALVCIPLLGELGWLLRRDPAGEWVAALPVRPRELELARVLHLSILLACLALGSTVPAAVLAPPDTALSARLLLPALGIGLIVLLAALLLLVQNLLGERAEGALVLLQTVLVVAAVAGIVLGVRHLPLLARMPALGAPQAPALWWILPPAWFAAPLATGHLDPARLWLPLASALAGLALLFALPAPAGPRHWGRSWLAILLAPARTLAQRIWVRSDERGPFDLLYEALPREREVVLRAVPLFAIPLAFLALASTESGAGAGSDSDVLALLFFTAGAYLPVLLAHVPASATPAASWILSTAPVSAGAVVSGSVKALALRFLVPLYGLLALVGGVWGGPLALVRLALPGFLVALLCLRWLYPRCVAAPPLSIPPEEVHFDLDLFGLLGGLALGLTVFAVLANRFLDAWWVALLVSAALAGLELAADRNLRRKLG